jgi:hypothetical protein
VLQHAWAELAHDRSYKFSGALPAPIQRQLNLYSGMLEIVDSAFDRIATEIDSYSSALSEANTEELLDAELNSLSAMQFLERLERQHKFLALGKKGVIEEAINELHSMGVLKISGLQQMVTDGFLRDYESSGLSENAIAFLRTLALYSRTDDYLSKSASEWTRLPEYVFDFVGKKYGRESLTKALALHGKTIRKKPPARQTKTKRIAGE